MEIPVPLLFDEKICQSNVQAFQLADPQTVHIFRRPADGLRTYNSPLKNIGIRCIFVLGEYELCTPFQNLN
jgi:hypothetical protein